MGRRRHRALQRCNARRRRGDGERIGADAQSFSPSAQKPREVVASWRRRFPLIEVVDPVAATLEELCLAHDADYVRGVLSLRLANGFGNHLAEVAASLPWTSGAMSSAARIALAEGCAAAPVSGFHHAGHAQGGGFCTFNGLMVTALALRRDRLVRRVGILDFDQHYGNGTADIIRELGLHWVRHYCAGAEWERPDQAERFLEAVPEIVARFADCDLLLYQAGADPHIDDPLGGWLTTDQLRERDRHVFTACKVLGLPVAWNLAGGYQANRRKLLDIHDNTMRECLAAFSSEPG